MSILINTMICFGNVHSIILYLITLNTVYFTKSHIVEWSLNIQQKKNPLRWNSWTVKC